MVQAVIFDWAGTVVDFGSRAPMQAFVNLFRQYGLEISIEDARGPMGVNKWNHIEALLGLPKVASQWLSSYGRLHQPADIDEMLKTFLPMNLQSIRECSELVPGTAEVCAALRGRGILIGSTTGYTRALLDELMGLAAQQGYRVDASVCAGETALGRPSEQMMLRSAELLGLTNPRLVIKVDDTVPGLLEGKRYGCWTVGVAASGNATGLSRAEYEALPSADRKDMLERAYASFDVARPDFIIESVADLLPVIDEINDRLRRGEHPSSA